MYPLSKRCLAEFVGTLALVFVGVGSILSDRVTGGGVSLVGIALAHGLTIAVMASAFGHISGGTRTWERPAWAPESRRRRVSPSRSLRRSSSSSWSAPRRSTRGAPSPSSQDFRSGSSSRSTSWPGCRRRCRDEPRAGFRSRAGGRVLGEPLDLLGRTPLRRSDRGTALFRYLPETRGRFMKTRFLPR
jgi:hypothetical protein